jgi:hypothetical protein
LRNAESPSDLLDVDEKSNERETAAEVVRLLAQRKEIRTDVLHFLTVSDPESSSDLVLSSNVLQPEVVKAGKDSDNKMVFNILFSSPFRSLGSSLGSFSTCRWSSTLPSKTAHQRTAAVFQSAHTPCPLFLEE